MEFVPSASANGTPSLEGCTLVIACAAHATVGQLAADLIINTLNLRRAGLLLTPHVLPCCGNDALGDTPAGALSTALEVFMGAIAGLAVVQQRSPAARGSQKALAADLAAWAERAGVARVVCLAGVEPRKAAQVASLAGAPAFRYVCGRKCTITPPSDWQTLETDTLGGVPLCESRTPPWPLLQACDDRGVPCAALLLFASDGDNALSGAELASRASVLLPCGAMARTVWKRPAAWAFAADDDEHAVTMY
jgi:proteasome assembly chaperone 2